MPPRLLRFTDDQLAALMRAAKPIRPIDRSNFLVDVATALDGSTGVANDQFARVLARVQCQHR